MNTCKENIVLTTEEYVKPEVEVIEIENEEGILAASGSLGGFDNGGGYEDLLWGG